MRTGTSALQESNDYSPANEIFSLEGTPELQGGVGQSEALSSLLRVLLRHRIVVEFPGAGDALEPDVVSIGLRLSRINVIVVDFDHSGILQNIDSALVYGIDPAVFSENSCRP